MCSRGFSQPDAAASTAANPPSLRNVRRRTFCSERGRDSRASAKPAGLVFHSANPLRARTSGEPSYSSSVDQTMGRWVVSWAIGGSLRTFRFLLVAGVAVHRRVLELRHHVLHGAAIALLAREAVV